MSPRPLFLLPLIAALTLLGLQPAKADAYRTLCGESGTGCISATGYDGDSFWNNPVDSRGNNCTNYAAYRLHLRGIENPGNLLNASNWAHRSRQVGITVDRTPMAGSIAQWTRGRFAPKYGHVAYVEKVFRRYIVLSDSNYLGGSKRWRVSRRDWQWPNNFIHFTTAVPK